MKIHSIHAPFSLSIADPDEGVRHAAVRDILRVMENSIPLIQNRRKDVYLVIHPGHHIVRTAAEEQFEYCLESLNEILDSPFASEYHVCIENMLSSHFGGKAEELIEIIEKLKNYRVSICLDTSHSVYDSSPEQFLEEVFPYLETVHISDNFNQPFGEFHGIPMTLIHSKINWKHFFGRLRQKINTSILEIRKPTCLDNDIFLDIDQIIIKQIKRFI
jgi:sugar phosphate isomerase/epimerase